MSRRHAGRIGWSDPTAQRAIRPEVEKVQNFLEENLLERDARILLRHFGFVGGKVPTRRELADMEGVSETRIDQLRDRALERLRVALDGQDPEEIVALVEGTRFTDVREEDLLTCQQCGRTFPPNPTERRGRPRKYCHDKQCQKSARRAQRSHTRPSNE
ncbi:hypothetical protein [Actinoallomurus acaciae]|uniref:RNA polymerase sigma-70 region 4 domain-containing protein n=1 Tax=Actinoallomurus acaciae TaxID=502577 RepID=A0ABV5Y7K0_9ACTN